MISFVVRPAVDCLLAQRSELLAIAMLLVVMSGSGCGKPAAIEPAVPAAATQEANSTADTTPSESNDMPVETASAEAAATAEGAEQDTAAEPAELPDWQPSEELAQKLNAEPSDLGGYSMRLPTGFSEATRGAASPESTQPFLFAFNSPAVEGASPAIISVTIHPPGEEFPDRDIMLAAYFANVATKWPDSQRHETEQGTVGDFPASRAYYEATLPGDQTFHGVVYLIDHGAQRVVLQGMANSGTSDFPIELIDAAIETFGRKKE